MTRKLHVISSYLLKWFLHLDMVTVVMWLHYHFFVCLVTQLRDWLPCDLATVENVSYIQRIKSCKRCFHFGSLFVGLRLNWGRGSLWVFCQFCIPLVFSKIILDADLLSDVSLHALSVVTNRQMYDLLNSK